MKYLDTWGEAQVPYYYVIDGHVCPSHFVIVPHPRDGGLALARAAPRGHVRSSSPPPAEPPAFTHRDAGGCRPDLHCGGWLRSRNGPAVRGVSDGLQRGLIDECQPGPGAKIPRPGHSCLLWVAQPSQPKLRSHIGGHRPGVDHVGRMAHHLRRAPKEGSAKAE